MCLWPGTSMDSAALLLLQMLHTAITGNHARVVTMSEDVTAWPWL